MSENNPSTDTIVHIYSLRLSFSLAQSQVQPPPYGGQIRVEKEEVNNSEMLQSETRHIAGEESKSNEIPSRWGNYRIKYDMKTGTN